MGSHPCAAPVPFLAHLPKIPPYRGAARLLRSPPSHPPLAARHLECRVHVTPPAPAHPGPPAVGGVFRDAEVGHRDPAPAALLCPRRLARRLCALGRRSGPQRRLLGHPADPRLVHHGHRRPHEVHRGHRLQRHHGVLGVLRVPTSLCRGAQPSVHREHHLVGY